MDVALGRALHAPTTDLLAARYRRLERLARGAGGQTWRAHDERLGRTVLVQCAPWRTEAARVVHVLARPWSSAAAPLLDAGVQPAGAGAGASAGAGAGSAATVYAVFPDTPWPSLADLADSCLPLTASQLDVVEHHLRAAVSALEGASGTTVALSSEHVVVDPQWLRDPAPSDVDPLCWMPALGPAGRAARRRPDVEAVVEALRGSLAPRHFAATRPRLTPHLTTAPVRVAASSTAPTRARRSTTCVSV